MTRKLDTPEQARIRVAAKLYLLVAALSFFAAVMGLVVALAPNTCLSHTLRFIVGAISGTCFSTGMVAAVHATVKFSRIPVPEEMMEE